MKHLSKLIYGSSFLLLIQWHAVFSQNLIQNPGFEVMDSCPDLFAVEFAHGWERVENTPDSYNSCAPLNVYSVPDNYFGFQYSHSGCAYAGLITYDSAFPYYREYLQTKLDSTLTIGVKYFVSFYLNLGSISGQISGSNKFGCKLSTVPYSTITDSSPATDNTAMFYSDSIIVDTLNWTKISGSFIADSAYNYIAFGNYFDSIYTQYSIVFSTSFIRSYYYIDDICLSSDSMTCIGVTDTCHSIPSPSGIQDLSIKFMICYPSPFNDELKINMRNQQEYTLQLYNAFGAKVLVQSFSLSANINTAMLAPGMYFYKITDRAGKVWSGKVLKE